MDLPALLSPVVQQFIREHEHDDPYQLALQADRYPSYPIAAVAEQIRSRQKAKHKLPEWYTTKGVVFPPPLSIEQCSSQPTAQYKQRLVQGAHLADLTGGAGVDTYYLSQSFAQTNYVESDVDLVQLAQHNFGVLRTSRIRTYHTTAEEFLAKLAKPIDCIYLDPARRGAQHQRVFRLEESQPNVLALRDTLLAKARTVLLKTAPLLDIQAVVQSLAHVAQVHVVAVDNEVKEVVYVLSSLPEDNPEITAMNLHSGAEEPFSFRRTQEAAAPVTYAEPLTYLYEPNAALMKAGAFKLIAQHFGLHKLHPHTHLYTADRFIADFPGRKFRHRTTLPYRKKEVGQQLPAGRANIATRNFPDAVATIRRRLGLRDGGDVYLFAVRLFDKKLRIIITEKC